MFEIHPKGDVSVLKLNYGKANTFDVDSCRSLTVMLGKAEASSSKAFVITGEGSIFSAGVDLKKLSDGGKPYLDDFLPALEECFQKLIDFNRPLIGALNGHAIAGGCVLAAACDHRIMAEDGGNIGVPELLVGVPFPVTAFELMRHMLSPQVFAETIYLGRLYRPQEALKKGLVHELCPVAELLPRALSIAKQYAALPSTSFEMTKRQARQPMIDNIERNDPRFKQEIIDIWGSDAVQATIASYVQTTIKKTRTT